MQSLASSLIDWIAQGLASLQPLDFAAIALAYMLIRLARRAGIWVYALVALPGTALHELAHFTIALVLGARPSFPGLIPHRTESVWQLGEVRFRPGHVRAMFVGLAPLLLAPLALWWTFAYAAHTAWPWRALHVWIVAAFLHACLPSKTDWRLALPALVAVAIAAGTALVGWYFWLK